MGEIEQSVMARLAIKQRTTAWQKQRNASDATVDWQFTTEEARGKLKQLYP